MAKIQIVDTQNTNVYEILQIESQDSFIHEPEIFLITWKDSILKWYRQDSQEKVRLKWQTNKQKLLL